MSIITGDLSRKIICYFTTVTGKFCMYITISINHRLSITGEEKEIAITVKSSKGFPLDVYYLMDFSASMKNDLDQLKTLSDSVGKIT